MDLPITPSLWLAAAAPLTAVLVLLIGVGWKASSAASAGYFLAAILALTLFRSSLGNVALQSVKGVWDALFIAYLIAPALLLYEISDEAGAFGAIRRGIEAITPNDLLHILAFGWAFPSFLQSITGFGAPIAVAAPLLLAIGVKPLWAVAIPIIGHAWAKTFGTLGVAWEALLRVADVSDPMLAVVATGLMLAVANLLAGFTIAWLYGRGQRNPRGVAGGADHRRHPWSRPARRRVVRSQPLERRAGSRGARRHHPARTHDVRAGLRRSTASPVMTESVPPHIDADDGQRAPAAAGASMPF